MQLCVSLLLIFIVCSGFKYWIIQCIILATATTLIEKMTQETFITNMHARIKKNISRKRSSYFSCCYCIFLKIFSHCIYIFLILNQQCPYSSPYPSFCLSISLSIYLSLTLLPMLNRISISFFQLILLQSHVTQSYYYIDLHNSFSNY